MQTSDYTACNSSQRPILLGFLELEIALVQAIHSRSALLRQHGQALWFQRTGEETRLPLFALGLALGSPLALPLFQIRLQSRGLGVLLTLDSGGDTFPESPALVRQLLFGRGTVLWRGEEGVDVDEQHALVVGGLFEILAAVAEVHLVRPVAVDAAQHVLVQDVLYTARLVVVRICALEDDAFDFVLLTAEVAFFEVVEDDFEVSLGAGYVAGVCDCHAEVAAEEAAEVGGRVG